MKLMSCDNIKSFSVIFFVCFLCVFKGKMVKILAKTLKIIQNIVKIPLFFHGGKRHTANALNTI